MTSARQRLWPVPIDGLVAALAVAAAVLAVVFDGDTTAEFEPVDLAAAALGGTALLVRHLRPAVTLAVIVAARAVLTIGGVDRFALVPAIFVALFAVTRTGNRRTALTIAAVGAVATALITASLDDDEPFAEQLATEGALMLVPIAVGDATRARAERTEELIETEATARVQAERLRIARDLHDVVAHGLSTIAVQSGIASHLLDRDPALAKDALDVINVTGKESLQELRTMVGVLRSTDEAPLRPIPTDPDDLHGLVRGAGDAGVPVRLEVTGSFPDHVSEAAVVAVHRILQEALTNVARHAGGVEATVSLHHGDDAVDVVVRNPAPRRDTELEAPASTGVGLVGMRERAESLGGRLEAGPLADGGFEVRAVVPYYRHVE